MVTSFHSALGLDRHTDPYRLICIMHIHEALSNIVKPLWSKSAFLWPGLNVHLVWRNKLAFWINLARVRSRHWSGSGSWTPPGPWAFWPHGWCFFPLLLTERLWKLLHICPSGFLQPGVYLHNSFDENWPNMFVQSVEVWRCMWIFLFTSKCKSFLSYKFDVILFILRNISL